MFVIAASAKLLKRHLWDWRVFTPRSSSSSSSSVQLLSLRLDKHLHHSQHEIWSQWFMWQDVKKDQLLTHDCDHKTCLFVCPQMIQCRWQQSVVSIVTGLTGVRGSRFNYCVWGLGPKSRSSEIGLWSFATFWQSRISYNVTPKHYTQH